MLKKLFNNRARQAILEQNAKAEATAQPRAHHTTIRAQVTRADGTKEPERIVSYGHRNPIIHAIVAPLAYLNGAFWNSYHERQSKRRLQT